MSIHIRTIYCGILFFVLATSTDFLFWLWYNQLAGKQWGVEHRQPHSGPFVCIFPYLPRLAPASLRHLRKNPKQKSLLWGAQQFWQSCFSSSQVKSRRKYPLVFSRDFPQNWRKATCSKPIGVQLPTAYGTA